MYNEHTCIIYQYISWALWCLPDMGYNIYIMRIYTGWFTYTSVFARDWFSLYFDKGVGIRDGNRATGIKVFIINVIIRTSGIEQKNISIKRPIDQQRDFQFHQV